MKVRVSRTWYICRYHTEKSVTGILMYKKRLGQGKKNVKIFKKLEDPEITTEGKRSSAIPCSRTGNLISWKEEDTATPDCRSELLKHKDEV